MITIRPARFEDSPILFRWRNDPQTRAASGTRDELDWPDHDAWVARALADDHRRLYIAERDDDGSIVPVGMCRFDLSVRGDEAEISINLNPAERGKGLGGAILAAGIAAFRADVRPVNALRATIRPENRASVRLFERSGFERSGGDGEFDYYARAVSA